MFRIPTLVAQGAEIWGATAMVVAELLIADRLAWPLDRLIVNICKTARFQ